MGKDNQAARDKQAASWRESIEELTKGKPNQRGADSETDDEGAKTERSAGSKQTDDTQSQPPEKESARDFIQRKMREERGKKSI